MIYPTIPNTSVIQVCETCQEPFKVTPSRIRKTQNKGSEVRYCSNDCVKKDGPNNPKWKGGKYLSNGYVMILSKDHPNATKDGYVREHRLVVEGRVGRFLLPTEHVHHHNEVKTDNRCSNLVLMEGPADHKIEHAKYKEVPCSWCGATLLRSKRHRQKFSKFFCNNRCQLKWMQLNNRLGSGLRIMGFDLSLSSTGLVVIVSNKLVGHARVTTTTKICTEERISKISHQALIGILRYVPDLVVLESKNFNNAGGFANALHELQGVVKNRLWKSETPFVLCAPGTLKKDATGNGRASKEEMIEAAYEWWPELRSISGKTDDLADALHLARYGAKRYWELVEES